MRLLYFHQYFCTPNGPGGTRSYEFARRWASAGHRVEDVTGSGYDPTLPTQRRFVVDGIHVTKLAIEHRSTTGYTRRLLSFLAFAAQSSILAARRRDVDVVLATSTPLTIAFPALASHHVARRPVVFEVRDVWPDAAIEAGVLRNHLLIALARQLERAVYRRADRIVALSTGMVDRIAAKGHYGHKLTMIPNCCDLDRFRPGLDGSRTRKRHGTGNAFVVLYAGALSLANDVEYLAQVIELMRNETDIEWWFAGQGNRRDWLQARIKAAGISNVKLLGARPKHEMPMYMAAADVGIVSFIPQPVYYENSPNKFFDYIAAGLPVLFNRSTWLEPHLHRWHCGWVCKSRQPQEMARRIRELSRDRDRCRRAGAAARAMAEAEFSRDTMADRYLDLLLCVSQASQGKE